MVKIELANQVSEAVSWCLDHLSNKDWEVATKWPTNSWEFKFKNPEDATHFALKWT